MKVSCRQFNLPFKHPFTISKGTKTHQPTLIVSLELGPFKGYGEAPAITYYNITVEQMIADLESKKTFVEKFAFTTPERYWHYLHHLFPNNPFLVCALDMAGWDLYGKMQRKPLHELWNTTFDEPLMTSFTIGLDSIENMVKKMEEQPWPVYKIKLGVENDIAIIEALRKHTTSVFRVDANAGWMLEEALQKIPLLAKLGVELVEQPLAKENREGMLQLYNASPLPLFADESCMKEDDVTKCAGCFHGVNIKFTKCSGITPALRMIAKAKELNLKVMVGCMNETTVGSAPVAHMISLLNYADVDGPLLLAQDVATGLEYKAGYVHCNKNFGSGIALKEAW